MAGRRIAALLAGALAALPVLPRAAEPAEGVWVATRAGPRGDGSCVLMLRSAVPPGQVVLLLEQAPDGTATLGLAIRDLDLPDLRGTIGLGWGGRPAEMLAVDDWFRLRRVPPVVLARIVLAPVALDRLRAAAAQAEALELHLPGRAPDRLAARGFAAADAALPACGAAPP